MAACQGTPTATQYTTTVSTSYAERTSYSTIFSTINNGVFLRPRQDPGDSASTPSPTDPSTSLTSSRDGTFGINEVETIVQTITYTDTFFFTDTIPILTLYDSCSNSDSSTTITRTSSAPLTSSSSTSVSIPSDVITDLSQISMAADGKATTTSGGLTIVISEFVTTVNGVETIFATPVQTLLNTSDGFLNHSQRTGVIAGAAVGGVIILVALLGLLFYFRRTRQVRQRLLEEKRAKERPPRHLLEDEADDYSFGRGPPMMAQHWDSTSFTSGGSSPSAPRLLRARGSKTGSLFQEDVWPPPSEVMQDPLLTAHDIGSSLSLAIGLPVEGSSMSSQADVSQTEFKQPSPTNNLISSADAYAFGAAAPMGAGHPMQRSSAYESIRSNDSADYYYNARSHSRAESAEPLLDDAGRSSVSPPPMAARTLAASPTNTLDRRGRKSNLRVSYTADDFQHVGLGSSPPRADHSRVGTGYSAGSISPRNEHLVASPVEGVSTGRTEEVPPMYHTIPRDAV